MRRCLLLMGLLATGGCSDFRSMFSAHAGVVAEVRGEELTAERLSEIMTAGRGAEPTRDAAKSLAQLWVDHALFAQAAATGALPIDSASIAEAAWSQIAEMRSRRWHDTLAARRPAVGLAQADSVYRTDDVRVLQHILFRATPSSPDAERAEARQKAETTLARARRGADFGALAAELSQDPGSAADSGFLPPSPRGQFVPPFDSAAWELAPGGTSEVVETRFGFHLIRRPPADRVRQRLADYLKQRSATRADSLYMDSLATAGNIDVRDNAPDLIKEALDDLHAARRSTKVVTSFAGGTLTLGELTRWLQALSPQYAMQLKSVPDSMVRRFAKLLTQNMLLLRAADSAGIHLTAGEWSGIVEAHGAGIKRLRQDMGLTDAAVQDTALRPAERKKLAMAKVEQYFDELAAGTRQFRPMPPGLAAVLRDRGGYRVFPAGINRAVELAKTARTADTANGAGPPPSPLQPAPGPPPIPGGGDAGADTAGSPETSQQGAP